MNGPRYWGPDGQPLPFKEWCVLFESSDRSVARDDLVLPSGERVLISTVWLGIAIDYAGDLPLIFETMVFFEREHEADEYQVRSCTREEARAVHAQALEYVRRIVADQ